MSPARPREPKKLIQVLAHNTEHEIILRVSRKTRLFLLACLIALMASGTGTTFGAIVETVRLLIDSGLVSP